MTTKLSGEPNPLSDIFDRQKNFMVLLGHDPETMSVAEKTQHTIVLVVAAVVELAEFLQELNWKPWKRTQKIVDETKVFEEIIDVLHFVVELMVLWGLTAQSTYDAYVAKMDINIARQKRGY